MFQAHFQHHNPHRQSHRRFIQNNSFQRLGRWCSHHLLWPQRRSNYSPNTTSWWLMRWDNNNKEHRLRYYNMKWTKSCHGALLLLSMGHLSWLKIILSSAGEGGGYGRRRANLSVRSSCGWWSHQCGTYQPQVISWFHLFITEATKIVLTLPSETQSSALSSANITQSGKIGQDGLRKQQSLLGNTSEEGWWGGRKFRSFIIRIGLMCH